MKQVECIIRVRGVASESKGRFSDLGIAIQAISCGYKIRDFPINLRESFPIVVNPVLLVETKFAFTFGQKGCKKQ